MTHTVASILETKTTAQIEYVISNLAPETSEKKCNMWIDALEQSKLMPDPVRSDVCIAKRLVNKYKDASQRGLDCSLSFDHMRSMLNSEECSYTGKTVDTELMSIERIDNKIGYTDINTIMVSKTANSLKNTLLEGDNPMFDSLSELEVFVAGMRKAGVV
tara:strand:+ start:46312 stop:46791 length:480 start_codon:yes stop_codon:yes gene_type:complete